MMPTPSPITGTRTRTVSDYRYAASVATSFFGGSTTADPVFFTLQPEQAVTFNAFSTEVRRIAGNFFVNKIAGLFTIGSVKLTVTDGSGTVTPAIANATTSSFIDFFSDGSIAQMTLAAVQPGSGSVWPSVVNLTLAAAVPEPAAYIMLLAGLDVVGLLARRSRS